MKFASIILLALFLAGCASPPQKSQTAEALTALQSNQIEIVSATYGTDVYFSDVTDRTIQLLNSQKEFFARPGFLQTDPNPGWNKAYVTIYNYRGKRHLFCSGEGGKVSIPALIQNAH